MGITAIGDRILIIQDEPKGIDEKLPQTGIIHSIGSGCSREGLDVKEGDHVAFGKGAHPEQGDYKVLREEQLYAKIL